MSKQVPLVMYDSNGERRLVGTVEVDGGKLSGAITNTTLALAVDELRASAFVIMPEMVVPVNAAPTLW